MDIFVFTNPTAPTLMEQGKIIEGFDSKMWVERYDIAGEFKFVAKLSSGIKTLLPIGAFVSHIDTNEVMVVENHEITDDNGKEPVVSISGRGFETYLENRVVGSNKTFPISGTMTDYALSADYSWNQAVLLINNHILLASLISANDELPYTQAISSVPGTTGTNVARTIKRQDVYKALLDILKIDALGIKVWRPGPNNPLGSGSANVAFQIHRGVDRSASVIFSYDTGEIQSADYLWSNKRLKNAALVTGKWVETEVTTGPTKYARRMMYVDASDIDNVYTVAPSGATLTTVVAAMQQRGLEALAAQNDVALTKAEISREAVRAIYRTDYDVGDIITVSGDYNETSKMRVSEYVEIEDEKGKSAYPTLAAL